MPWLLSKMFLVIPSSSWIILLFWEENCFVSLVMSEEGGRGPVLRECSVKGGLLFRKPGNDKRQTCSLQNSYLTESDMNTL